ncbi:Fe-S cluster assembly protein SufD [bacterium]|nr:Fe-S cluster assembly protein SufD [bacterium]
MADGHESFLATYERIAGDLPGRGAAWWTTRRDEGAQAFGRLGIPTRKNEEWRFTDVKRVGETAFAPADDFAAKLTTGEVNPHLFADDFHLAVYVNGVFSPDLSRVGDLPAGVRIESVASLLDRDPAAIEGRLGALTKHTEHHFVALNTALARDGAYVHIPKNVKVERPIQILFLTTANGQALMTHPRNVFVLEDGAECQIVESYAGAGAYFTNAVTEIFVGENAHGDHVKAQFEAPGAFHIATAEIHQGRSSNFRTNSISIGAAIARNDINVSLDAEDIISRLDGLYLGDGTQLVDHHTRIDHIAPNCNSYEDYKGILGGKAKGVFNGKIYVHRAAQKTDAKQNNKGLLLSREAQIDTKPQLEIYADDVKCTHGATVGQLDEQAMFYLRTRAIGRADARNILIYAFASDILRRIAIEPVRERLDRDLHLWLPKDSAHGDAS